jgi:DNA-directed RNA polymerase subunit omega
MIQLPEEFDSVYRYIVVVAQRAEQLINGAKPRQESRRSKPTLRAREEVDAGEVTWRVLTQEELDAHRQAMVEQFRAEVDAASEPRAAEPIPDVLPTAETPAVAEADDTERDDELERLQRLLGMTKAGAAADDDESDDESDDEDSDDDGELSDDDDIVDLEEDED